MSKLKLPGKSAPFLCEIDRYIRQYNLRGQLLESAAPDVLDGWAIRSELDPLVRRRLLSIVNYESRAADDRALCGWQFTTKLTDRAISSLWPDRVGAAAQSQEGGNV